MKDEVTKARDKFMVDVQKLGFPVNIRGGGDDTEATGWG
jgi:hypothetical protein